MALLNYRVGGRTVLTATAANQVMCALWNPSVSKSIYVQEIYMAKNGIEDDVKLTLITTRGQPNTTVTPDIDNNDSLTAAPQSGALLDLEYLAQPTISSPDKEQIHRPNATGPAFVWFFTGGKGLRVPAGNGLALVTRSTPPGEPTDVTFVWKE